MTSEMSGYKVINLENDEEHGQYETLAEARGCVKFDRLTSYQIWMGETRIEECNLGEEMRQAVSHLGLNWYSALGHVSRANGMTIPKLKQALHRMGIS